MRDQNPSIGEFGPDPRSLEGAIYPDTIAPRAFKMDLDSVPDEVDAGLAHQCSGLIREWRANDLSAEDALRALEALGVRSQGATNEATLVYIYQSSLEFVIESGLSPETADKICQEVLESTVA